MKAHGGGSRGAMDGFFSRPDVKSEHKLRVTASVLIAALFSVGWAPVLRRMMSALTVPVFHALLGAGRTTWLTGTVGFDLGSLMFYSISAFVVFYALSVHVLVRRRSSLFARLSLVAWSAYCGLSIIHSAVILGPLRLPQLLGGLDVGTYVFVVPLLMTTMYEAVFLSSVSRSLAGLGLTLLGIGGFVYGLWHLTAISHLAAVLFDAFLLAAALTIAVLLAAKVQARRRTAMLEAGHVRLQRPQQASGKEHEGGQRTFIPVGEEGGQRE